MKLSRRTLLRGMLGGGVVSLGLPTLEAMLNQNGTALADGEPLPIRFVTWVFGNGVRLDSWIPDDTGPDYTLSEELAPIANVKNECTLLTGFRNYVAGRRGHHDGMAGVFSCHPFTALEPMGAPYASKFGGPSVDQVAADYMGEDTTFKSLQIGVTKRHLIDQGPTLATMSHRGPDKPLMAQRDPQKLYDSLFNSFMPTDDPDQLMRASALDAVLKDAHRLKSRVGKADGHRIDAHLESIFQLQKQVMAIPPNCDLPLKPGKLDWNEDGSEPLIEINEVMAQLLVTAFMCDLTRVASFMFTAPSGGTQFTMLTPDMFPGFPEAQEEDFSHAGHHSISHYNLPYQQEYIHLSTIVSMQSFAYLIELMKNAEEGDGTLLDQSCVLMSSCVSEGWAHSEVDYPLIVAGRAGGRLKPNVGHFRSTEEQSVSDVTLACLKAVVPFPDDVTEFGRDEGVYLGRSTTPCAAIFG